MAERFLGVVTGNYITKLTCEPVVFVVTPDMRPMNSKESIWEHAKRCLERHTREGRRMRVLLKKQIYAALDNLDPGDAEGRECLLAKIRALDAPRTTQYALPPLTALALRWYLALGAAQKADDWHKWRYYKFFTGSRSAAALGLDIYKTAQELFLQLTGQLPEDPENHHMRRGTRLEPIAMDHYATETGDILIETPLLHHPTFWFLAVSPDRISGLVEGRLIECKCPEHMHTDAEVLRDYGTQTQYQMCVTGAQENMIVQFVESKTDDPDDWEMRILPTRVDHQWLQINWLKIIDFVQRVMDERAYLGMTWEIFRDLNKVSREVHDGVFAELLYLGYDPINAAKYAKEAMVASHRERFAKMRSASMFD